MKKRLLSLLVVGAIFFTSVDITVFAQPNFERTKRKVETEGKVTEIIEKVQEVEGANGEADYGSFSVSTVNGDNDIITQESNIASGSYEDVTWTIDSDGKLIVEGNGDYFNTNILFNVNPPWYDYREQILSAEISLQGATRLSGMFRDCSNLLSIDLSQLDTSQVTDMTDMFFNCSNLSSLDVSKFDTSQVTTTCTMFWNCSNLNSLDVSSFDTSQVTNMSHMFYGCSNLSSLDVSKFDTSQVVFMSGMFGDCQKLSNLNVSHFNTSQVTDMNSMFYNCRSLVNLDVSGFDTSKVIYIYEMFRNCESLSSLNVSNFDTSQAISMHAMFWNCSNLESLDVSDFDTSQVTYMNLMFGGCSNLKSLDVSGFDTSQVTDMCGMFWNCSSLEKLDVNIFDTSQVTDMFLMFKNCSSLNTLDVSNFETGNVTTMEEMFADCKNLVSLDLSNFNTNKVTNMSNMFGNCSNLSSLDVGGFETSNVTTVYYMFAGCSGLQILDLASFDLSQVTDAHAMLREDNNLRKIYVPRNLRVQVELPQGNWYTVKEESVSVLPQNKSESVLICRDIILDDVSMAPEEKIPENKSGILVVDGETGLPISDAKIKIELTDLFTKENGIAYTEMEGMKGIHIEKGGYREQSANKNLQNGTTTTISIYSNTKGNEIISVKLERGEQVKELLNEKEYITAKEDASGLEEKIVIRIGATGNISYYQLVQNNKIIAETKNGVFDFYVKTDSKTGKIYSEDFLAGYKVQARVITQSGKMITKDIGLNVSDYTKYEGVLGIPLEDEATVDFNDGLKLTVPNSVPLLGGSELKVGWEDKIPVQLSIDDDGKVRVAVNMGKFDSKNWKKWEEKEKAYQELAKKAWKDLKKSRKNFSGKKSAYHAALGSIKGNIMGYGEGYLSDAVGENLCINVGVVFEVEGERKITHYYFVYIPFYLTYGGGAKLEGGGNFNLYIKDGRLYISGGDLEIKPSIYAKLEGGAGADGVLSVGAYGKVGFDYLVRFSDAYQKFSLVGNYKIKATAFWWSKVLAESKGTTVLYDSNRKKESTNDEVLSAAVNYADMSNAELISMDYLRKRKNIEDEDEDFLGTQSEMNKNIVLQYAFENAAPKLVRNEENLYLFYLDGVSGRTSQNQTALFYKKSEDNGLHWTEAVRVDGNVNEHADYNYDVVADDEKVYVVWSKANQVFGEEMVQIDSSEAISKVAENMDLMIAIIDDSTQNIERKTIQTEKADLQPQIALDGEGNIWVAWVSNDVSAQEGLLSNDNIFQICYASSQDNFVQINQTPLEKGQYLLTLDLGNLGSTVVMAADIDVDGNLNTQEDREVFLLSQDGVLSQMTTNEKTDSVPVFANIGDTPCLMWHQDGNIVYTAESGEMNYVFGENSDPMIGQEFSVLSGKKGGDSIVWASTSLEKEAGVELYCTDYVDGMWSEIYKLSDLESEYTTAISGYREGEDYKIAYLGSNYENEELISNIHVATTEEKIDTIISYYVEEKEMPGKIYPLNIFVENTGNETIEKIVITSNDGNIMEEIEDINLAPGESQEIKFDKIVLPDSITEVSEYSITVKAEGETELSDNIINLSLGQTDFEIEAVLDYSNGNDFASVAVTNQGIITSDAVVKVYSDEEHSELVYTKKLENIAQGETSVVVLDLTSMKEDVQVFYFEVSDENGYEIYNQDNATLLYVGQGKHLEYADEEKVEAVSISAIKEKKNYQCGESLETDDIKVTLHYSDGDFVEIVGFHTNAEEIDMNSAGNKKLTIFYDDLSVDLEIVVEKKKLDENVEIVLPYKSCSYNGLEHKPLPEIILNNNTLIEGMDYIVSYKNNIQAGVASVCIEGIGNYSGTLERTFVIQKGAAPIVEDVDLFEFNTISQNNISIDISTLIKTQEEVLSYEIIGIEENDESSGETILNGKPYIEGDRLVYSIKTGAEGDEADIILKISFANYEDTVFKVKICLLGKKEVAISGLNITDSTYTGCSYIYEGEAKVFYNAEDITDEIELNYNYSGIMENGEIFESSEKAPINAGKYTLTVSVAPEYKNYIGKETYSFEIKKADVRIMAEDMTIFRGESVPDSFQYNVTGLLGQDKLIIEPLIRCDIVSTNILGNYEIIPYGANAGMNYKIQYEKGTLVVAKKVVNCIVADAVYTGKAVKPQVLVYDGNVLLKEKRDYTIKYYNNINVNKDLKNENGIGVELNDDSDFFNDKIPYVKIIGKGNYKDTIYVNFNIIPATIEKEKQELAVGFVLKWKEQNHLSVNKNILPFQSLSGKKQMQINKDYVVKIVTEEAFDNLGNLLEKDLEMVVNNKKQPIIPKGYYGKFKLLITGIGNYRGNIEKDIWVTPKEYILKNATIVLGKNIKSNNYCEQGVVLTPAWYDSKTKVYYKVNETGVITEEVVDAKNVFVVKIAGKYLVYGKDYIVEYSDNKAVGTATMKIIGNGKYQGYKTVKYKITGNKINSKNVYVEDLLPTVTFRDEEVTQDNVTVYYGTKSQSLQFGKDYRITYKNNINVGTVRMKFTALPQSGYVGSFQQTFKIIPKDLENVKENIEKRFENYSIPYSKAGTEISEDEMAQILKEELGIMVTRGKDYKLSYLNNKKVAKRDDKSKPTVIIKGKGNLKGEVKIAFSIIEKELTSEEIIVHMDHMTYKSGKDESYQYKPSIKIMEGNRILKNKEDYQINYKNNTQFDYKEYLTSYKNYLYGNISEEEMKTKRPYIEIRPGKNGNYTGIKYVDIPIGEIALNSKNTYVIVSDSEIENMYSGKQVTPAVSVYYSENNKMIKKAKENKETQEDKLIKDYGLIKLKQKDNNEDQGDYFIQHGENTKAGKNKGSIMIVGASPLFSGNVKVKFTIFSKSVNKKIH